MENEFELGEALERLIRTLNRAKVMVDGVIEEVNDDFTCDVTINTVPYSSVPINILIGSQGDFYMKPLVGSACLIGFRDGSEQRPQIMWVQQAELFIFNQGNNGGMVLVTDLVSRLNKIENLVNNLVTQYNGHTHILALSSGTGTAAETVSQETGTLTPTVRGDIENTKILQ